MRLLTNHDTGVTACSRGRPLEVEFLVNIFTGGTNLEADHRQILASMREEFKSLKDERQSYAT